MVKHTEITSCAIFVLLSLSLLSSPVTASSHHGKSNFRVGFYDDSCPQAEKIVKKVVQKATCKNPGIAASLIRLYFHDCFVKGCDASILLESTPSGEETELKSPANLGINGLDVIDEAKARLERACPHTVSCADIISFATRDAVTALGLSPYDVPAGRRDGLSSIASIVLDNLPNPDATVDEMTKTFENKGISKAELVALLGAHSIGVAHCSTFEDELYNFNKTFEYNKLDTLHADYLRSICPTPGLLSSNDAVFPLNPLLGNKLSCLYYTNVLQGKAIMKSDQALLDDPKTNEMVRRYARKSNQWVKDFRRAMVKLGKVQVLTGNQGEIRKTCRFVNQRL